MSKGFVSSAKSYAKNVGKRVQRVVARQESATEALQGLSKDTKKLSRSVTKSAGSGRHREATHLVKQGRRAYNAKNYEQAEQCFRQALLLDDAYALAFTYLGHSLYQQGRTNEAQACWTRAVEVDPHSDAADKARQKLQHIELTRADTVKEMEKRLRGG